MIGYDFTYEPNQPTGAPIPGTHAGRWSVWGYANLDTPAKRKRTMEFYANEITRELPQYPPALHRVPVIDVELCPPAAKEAVVVDCLKHLGACLLSRVIIVGQWWPGIPLYPVPLSSQQIVAALEGTAKTRTAQANKDRDAMFTLARKHRPIIGRAAMVTTLGVIDRPDGGTGDNSQYGTAYYLREMAALAQFYRAAYPGLELCCWTCGAYQRLGGLPELSEDDCERLADVIWQNFDSFALYGEKQQTLRLGNVLSHRLLKQAA